MTTDEVRQALDQLAERWRQHPGEVFTDVGQASFNWFTQALQLRRGAELLEPEMLRNYEWYLEVLRAAPSNYQSLPTAGVRSLYTPCRAFARTAGQGNSH